MTLEYNDDCFRCKELQLFFIHFKVLAENKMKSSFELFTKMIFIPNLINVFEVGFVSTECCRHEKSMNKYAAWIRNQIFVDILFVFAVEINWNKFSFQRLNLLRGWRRKLLEPTQKKKFKMYKFKIFISLKDSLYNLVLFSFCVTKISRFSTSSSQQHA